MELMEEEKMVKKTMGKRSSSWKLVEGHVGSKVNFQCCIPGSEGVVPSRRWSQDAFLMSVLFVFYFPVSTPPYKFQGWTHNPEDLSLGRRQN